MTVATRPEGRYPCVAAAVDPPLAQHVVKPARLARRPAAARLARAATGAGEPQSAPWPPMPGVPTAPLPVLPEPSAPALLELPLTSHTVEPPSSHVLLRSQACCRGCRFAGAILTVPSHALVAACRSPRRILVNSLLPLLRRCWGEGMRIDKAGGWLITERTRMNEEDVRSTMCRLFFLLILLMGPKLRYSQTMDWVWSLICI